MPTATAPKKSATKAQSNGSTDPSQDLPESHRVVADQVGSGHIMRITHYVKVNVANMHDPNWGATLKVSGLDVGVKDFDVHGKVLIENMMSADFFAEEREVSQTEVIDQLLHAGADPFTVEFIKQDGEERTLRGRYISVDHFFGRSNVIDLDLPDTRKGPDDYDSRRRQVDHRTLMSIIIRGIKYTSKKKHK